MGFGAWMVWPPCGALIERAAGTPDLLPGFRIADSPPKLRGANDRRG
jgi:hypothetical protein